MEVGTAEEANIPLYLHQLACKFPNHPAKKAGQVSVPHFIDRKTQPPPKSARAVCSLHCPTVLKGPQAWLGWGEWWWRQAGAKALEEGAAWTASCGGTGLSQTRGTQGGKADPEAHMEQGGVPKA